MVLKKTPAEGSPKAIAVTSAMVPLRQPRPTAKAVPRKTSAVTTKAMKTR